MAAEIEYTGSGPSTRYYGAAEVISQNVAGNYSVIRFYAQTFNGPSGNSSSFYGGFGSQEVSADGWGVGIYVSGNPFLPSGYAQNQERWSDNEDHTLYHDSNGYLGPIEIRMTISGAHSWTGYDTLNVPRIAKAPSKITSVTKSNVTTTGFRVSYNAPNDNGDSLDGYDVDYSTSPTFATYTRIVRPTSPLYADISGLTPGTLYYVRVRAYNGVADAVWSDTVSQTTLPATAPGISTAPALNGQSAIVTLSPPGGVSGVTEYNIEYRPFGGSTTATSTTTTTKTVTGLTPGQAYEWRANAEIGGYTSPWSNWLLVTQPNPNTNPGDFYDGATADTADTDYAWTGTANGSTSTATGKNITGWRTFAQGNATSGGSGSVIQATGGYSGSFGAKIAFTADATAAGFIGGVFSSGAAAVAVGGTYVGSLYVQLPVRTQRLEGGIAWYDVSNALLSITWGDDVVVAPSTTTWTRLIAVGVAPASATKAAPVFRDVTGTSWSLWLGGDVIYADAAMISLGQLFAYFDGSLAPTTVYDFAWAGTAHASASLRYGSADAEVVLVDPLADPDCDPLPTPPVPPTIPADCIDEVGSWRRYTLAVPANEVREWTSTLPTLVLDTGLEAERQVRVRMYPNPDGVAPDEVDDSTWESEQIISYIPPSTEVTMDGVTERVWASVDGAEAVAADTLLYGTGGNPATWPEMRCGIGYVFTLDVPSDSTLGNLTTRVLLTQRM